MENDIHRRRALSREQSKMRVLAIAKMLSEGRRLKASEIQKRLYAQYDIVVDRKTIYSDIYAIDRIMPIDIMSGRNGGFMKWNFVGGGRRWRLKSG